MYNNYNPYGYNPQATPQPTAPQSSIIWVQGEAGAKSYLVAPNQSVMLMDSEVNRFYIKSSDVSGMPLPLRVFEYIEKTENTAPRATTVSEPTYVTREELNALEKRLLDKIGGSENE